MVSRPDWRCLVDRTGWVMFTIGWCICLSDMEAPSVFFVFEAVADLPTIFELLVSGDSIVRELTSLTGTM